MVRHVVVGSEEQAGDAVRGLLVLGDGTGPTGGLALVANHFGDRADGDYRRLPDSHPAKPDGWIFIA